jgi:hypothetical protein
LNGSHQIQVYADDLNLFGDNIKATKKNREAVFDASNEVLEVNTEKPKYMLMSYHQNAGQNHDIKKANKIFEDMGKFKYLEMTVTNHGKGKVFPSTVALEALRVVRGRQSAQMAVRLSALRAGRFLPPRKIPGTHFC